MTENLTTGWCVGHLGGNRTELRLNKNVAWVASKKDVRLFTKEKAVATALGHAHLQGHGRFVQLVENGEFKTKENVGAENEKWNFDVAPSWEEILARRE